VGQPFLIYLATFIIIYSHKWQKNNSDDQCNTDLVQPFHGNGRLPHVRQVHVAEASTTYEALLGEVPRCRFDLVEVVIHHQ